MPEYQLYIDGQLCDAEGGKTADSINPATEEPWARVARASRKDTQRAIAAARRAFDEGPWPRMSQADRAKILNQIADGLEARSQELAAVETHDSGGTIRKTSGDMMMGAAQLRYFAEMAPKLPLWEEIQVPQFPAQSKNYLQREPIGVCGQIIPWNFPLMMAVWKIGPALCTGNTLVLKPASDTPWSPLDLASIIGRADLPKGVVNVVDGSGAECGEELCTSPLVDKVALTGSTEVGRRVQQLASGTIKKVTLELGGKSANIILDDADLEMAIDGSLFGCFFHQGQACESGTRLFVSEKLHDEVVARQGEGARGREADADRHGVDQRLPPALGRRPLRRLQAERHRPRVRPRGHPRVHRGEARARRSGGQPAGEVLVRGAVRSVVTIEATATAEDVVARVRAACPEADLVFVFGAGCCEGTAPHLFAGYALTPEHARVGTAGGVGVFADAHVRRLYAGRRVVLDAEEDPLADGFSAEIPLGWRFVLRLG